MTVLLILLAAFSGVFVLADSDGYFCTGNGYLAYEMRWVGEKSSHILTIVRFGKDIGIEQLAPVELEEFQTHGMTCGRDFIKISAWSDSYYVDISDIDNPTLVADDLAHEVTSAGHQGNLGHGSDESVLDLKAGDTGGRFQLVILKASHPSQRGIEHFTVTELIQRDSREEILRRHRLFTGIFLETID
ncbi:MAG TPA: hypothetical protein VLU25_21635 [Acidobacteriota bacterium]|nr:hypothetical protein [Acidobacteriota bacterium]